MYKNEIDNKIINSIVPSIEKVKELKETFETKR